MPQPLDEFLDHLTRSGIINEDAAEIVREETSTKGNADTESVIDALDRHDLVSSFQSQVLRQGEIDRLLIADYVVLDKLGQGGMGAVYLARHRGSGQMAAVKVLSPTVLSNEEAVRRFRREMKATATLEHSNVVASIEAGEANGSHFLVMEHIDGVDLSQHVRQDGLLPVEQAIDYITQAARGIEHAHRHGVIHRDIKPSNLMLDKSGTVRLLDLGLARFVPAVDRSAVATQSELTGTGAVMGSFDFMAPEQAADTKHADQRSDIYSLGCTLFYLLTGRPPFGGETSVEKIIAHLEDPVPSLIDQRPDVSTEVDKLFRKMVAKEPSDRFQSMADVIEAMAGKADDSKWTSASNRPEHRSRIRNSILTRSSIIVAGVVCLLFAGVYTASPLFWSNDQAATVAPTRTRFQSVESGSATPPKDVSLVPTKTIDLLPLIDPSRDSVKGDWAQIGDMLITPNESFARMSIPFEPPREYVVRMEAERIEGIATLGIGVLVSGHQMWVGFDGSRGTKSGFVGLDGAYYPNEAAFHGRQLPVGKRCTLECEVRGNEVALRCEGRELVRWRGDPNRLWIPSEWKMPDPRKLFLTCWESTFRITKLEIEFPDPEAIGDEMRPAPTVAPFSADEAQKHQEDWAKYLGIPVEWTNSIGMKFRLIPPGRFEMGTDQEEVDRLIAETTDESQKSVYKNETPQHTVELTRPYYIGIQEVTLRQFRQFIAETGFETDAERDGRGGASVRNGTYEIKREFTWDYDWPGQTESDPVGQITWRDAMAFCRWLTQKEEFTYSLPTEAQWEFACRAGTTTRWWFGDLQSRPPESKPNPFGLVNMHGGVDFTASGYEEWCADFFSNGFYRTSPILDPVGPSKGNLHAIRIDASSTRIGKAFRYDGRGFRVVAVGNLSPKQKVRWQPTPPSLPRLESWERLENDAALQHSLASSMLANAHFRGAIAALKSAERQYRELADSYTERRSSSFSFVATIAQVLGDTQWRIDEWTAAEASWSRAADALQLALNENPKETQFVDRLAGLYSSVAQRFAECGLYERAARYSSMSFEQKWPQTGHLHRGFSAVLLNVGEREAHRRHALHLFEAVGDPKNTDSWAIWNVFNCCIDRGTKVNLETIREYSAQKVKQKQDAANLYNLAIAQFRSGSFNSARENVLAARAIGTWAPGRFLVPMTLHQSGRLEEGMIFFEDTERWYEDTMKQSLDGAVDMMPIFWWDPALVRVLRRETWQLYHEKLPTDPMARLIEARCLARLGETLAAEEKFAAAVADAADDAHIRIMRARVYSKLGWHEQAEADFDKAIELNPNDDTPLITRGRFHFEHGSREKGRTDLAAAAAKRPNELNRFIEGGWWGVGPFFPTGRDSSVPKINADPAGIVSIGEHWRADKKGRVSWKPLAAETQTGAVNVTSLRALRPRPIGAAPWDRYWHSRASVYAMTKVWSPEDRNVVILAASVGPRNIWLNGQLIHDSRESRTAIWADDRIPAKLRAGENTIVVNVRADWFRLRINDGPLDRGYEAILAGDWQVAAKAFEEGFERRPGRFPEVWFAYAASLLLNDQSDEYEQLRRRMHTLHRFHENDDWEFMTAATHYLVNADPQENEGLVVLAGKGARFDDFGTAILALAQYRNAAFEEAIQTLKGVDQQEWIAWPLLALMHHKLGDHDEAKQWLAKANAWNRDEATQIAENDRRNPIDVLSLCLIHLLRREANALLP